MRDKRFMAEHRGGYLKTEQHRQLMKWACDCVEHVLPLLVEKSDDRIKNVIMTAKEWMKGNATVSDARKASSIAHSIARESTDPTTRAIARAAGHAVATAHMSDHSLGGALYALRAVKSAGKSTDAEKKWQNEQLPSEIKEFVLAAISKKEQHFKIKNDGYSIKA